MFSKRFRLLITISILTSFLTSPIIINAYEVSIDKINHTKNNQLEIKLNYNPNHRIISYTEEKSNDISLKIIEDEIVGETELFWLLNIETDDFYQGNFTLRAIGDYCLIYTEGMFETNSTMEMIRDQIDNLIYPRITAFFGVPSDIDDNDRVVVLIYDIIDGMSGSSYVSGYFYSLNQYLNKNLNPSQRYSNEAELINIDTNTVNYNYYVETIAHELQHLIHFFNDRDENLWLDEGASMFSEMLVDKNPFTVVDTYREAFNNNPDVSLTHWDYDSNPGLVFANYGASFAFFVYLSEHFGGAETIQAITTSSLHGINSIETVLDNRGYDVEFEEIFRNWTIANLLDDLTIYNGWYGHTNISTSMKIDDEHYESSVPLTKNSVTYWGTDYIKFDHSLEEPFELVFLGDINTPYIITLVVDSDSGILVIPAELEADNTLKFSLDELGINATDVYMTVSAKTPPSVPSYDDDYPSQENDYWYILNPRSLSITNGDLGLKDDQGNLSITNVEVFDDEDFYWSESTGSEFSILEYPTNQSTGIMGNLIYDGTTDAWINETIDISTLENGMYIVKYYFYNETASGIGYSEPFTIDKISETSSNLNNSQTDDSLLSFLTSGFEVISSLGIFTTITIIRAKKNKK